METYDLVVVGGGINGTGIAVDAAGRGMSVLLLEERDLACATSSSSSKLIHGGLRYLEHFKFRLVSKALKEREILLKMAPHIIIPLQFRLPYRPHLRPAWIIRLGLFFYDYLSKRTSLPSSKSIRFDTNSILKPDITKGFDYYDCWVDDARLVIVNALSIIQHGGSVRTRSKVTSAWRENNIWKIEVYDMFSNTKYILQTKGLVNATGPWVQKFIQDNLHITSKYNIRLIKGSHIVVPRIHHQSLAYLLQNEDHRIVFVIPWMEKFSIIGTTDIEYHGNPLTVSIDKDEIDYLLKVYNMYFKNTLCTQDIVWTYSGVRPLYNDESNLPQTITRDYILDLNDDGNIPLLSVFGGKLTTYRKLAEHAIKKLSNYYPNMKDSWTHNSILPGGDIPGTRQEYADILYRKFPFLSKNLVIRYSYTYGTLSEKILSGVNKSMDLGEHFGCEVYEVEINYLVKYEWALTLDDIIWRRTKLGMYLSEQQKKQISNWLKQNSCSSRSSTGFF